MASSLMSTAKWRSLVEALERADLARSQIVVKFVDVAEPKTMSGLPWLNAPWSFADSGTFGPFPWVGVEWILLPDPPRDAAAHRAAIRAALAVTGKRYPVDDTPDGLRIVGHLPRPGRRAEIEPTTTTSKTPKVRRRTP